MAIYQFIESRFYNNGKAEARLTASRPLGYPDESDKYDSYIDGIGTGTSCYESLRNWIEELEIEQGDIEQLVIGLELGKWVDITDYI